MMKLPHMTVALSAAGTAYTIQANTVKTIDNASGNPSFLDMVIALKQMMDEAEVPREDRVIFIPPAGFTALLKDTGIKMDVHSAYEDLVIKGHGDDA